ncbi:MAG: DUF1549 domain-containing protein, partial [Planctomycetaceae bacterium]|nr:DUF1549 domain-containing protein [Planctomycetaceae bacterium]
MMIRPAVFLLLILSGSLPLIASETPVDFQKQIAPLFEQHCLRCHSENNSKGDFSLTSGEDLRANEFVTPGEPDSSYLIEMVTGDESSPPQMPQKAAPISAQEVQLLRTWIQQGAHWPTGVRLREKSKADASWWAYQPLQPSEKKSIDDFIQDRLAEQGLERNPESDRRTLIRRLSFDLHGLPPRPEEVEEFVNDPDPHAYEKLVDRFLAAPQYGERFARHWLDLAHYADTHGFERDQRRNDAWRYRDYVIQAFNEDKPYDRFLQEQIAGDVLWPEHEAAVIATGFLAAGPWDFVGQVETKSPELQRSARALDLDDMATQVMTATMATTINCARCHDHKLDPISQQEYYQLQAVFAGIKRESRVISEAALQNYEQKKQELLARLNAI